MQSYQGTVYNFMLNNKLSTRDKSYNSSYFSPNKNSFKYHTVFKDLQRNSVSCNKDQKMPLQKHRSMPIHEKKLRTRILQLLNSEQKSRSPSPINRVLNQNKFNRYYLHQKIIIKPKIKQSFQQQQITLAKIKSICQTRLINLSPKHDTPLKGRHLISNQNYSLHSNIFMKMCSIPKRKIKFFESPSIQHAKHSKTEPIESLTDRIDKLVAKQKSNFGPWEKSQQISQLNEGHMF